MTLIHEERASDSPYIGTVTRGRTLGAGAVIRPAESHWHMVFTRYQDKLYPIVVGPLTAAGDVTWTEGAEILWIKFKLGTYMPRLPVKNFLDGETILPEAASRSFWLDGSVWQFPDFENAETFVERLVREGVLSYDPLVEAALQGQLQGVPARTLRHHFLHVTGLTQGQIRQFERAQQAATLLQQGVSILDTVFEAGYFDQPHLTRSLKRWIGHTPAQFVQLPAPG